jgi:polyisoprenoid-binding protein YceI
MKNIVLGICVLMLAGFNQFGYAQNQQVKVDVLNSQVDWEGQRFFGGGHTGTIALKSGVLELKDGKVVSGEFSINMESIQVTDLEGETAKRLEDHLKTADFFDVGKFPIALFRIKQIDYANDNLAAVVGEIVIRGIAQRIAFPAEIEVKDGVFSASAKGIRVDRTLHDSQYGSLKFFKDLGRKVVHDEFLIHLNLKGTVQ